MVALLSGISLTRMGTGTKRCKEEKGRDVKARLTVSFATSNSRVRIYFFERREKFVRLRGVTTLRVGGTRAVA